MIVIDKDFTENRVLSEAFPQAKILFCKFHVKHFYKEVSDCDIPKCDREELRSKLRSVVYTASEAEYERLKSDIASLANDDLMNILRKIGKTARCGLVICMINTFV